MANQIHQFGPSIYPRMLWIAVGINIACVRDFFDTDIPDFEEGEAACVYNAHTEKPKPLGGLFIRFRSKGEMTGPVIAHESTHAALEIFDYCGCVVDAKNQEPFAYLVQWIADCCWQVKTGKYKDNA